MASTPNLRTGGQILVDVLKLHGVDTIFSVPGESYLATLDALYDASEEIRLITCRQEGGAANMADAYGKLTGRPGVCIVTRGPGASNASIGIHTAYQDSTPVVLLIGQVARSMFEREAFQEIDFRQMFGPMSKWVAQIDDPARIPEMVSRAFHTAVSSRPGPVVLALPEDVQTERTAAEDGQRYREVQPHPGAEQMAGLRAMLEKSQRPLVMIGGGGWSEEACADLAAFAEVNDLPVTATFRRQDLLDNRHPSYVGDFNIGTNPALIERVKASDLIVVIGPQLGEIVTSGYTLFEVPRPAQTLIHVHAGAAELGRVYQADMLINSGVAQFAAAAKAIEPITDVKWAGWRQDARADYEAFLKPEGSPGALDMAEVMTWLSGRLGDDAIVTNGAGNYAVWVHRFYQYRGFRTQLAPASGAMGYGVPAAVAAKIVFPERDVVSFSGDGCFLMNGQEIATAAQYGLKIVFIVVNNTMFGTIRMHQERHYPGRISGTTLVNPDFAALGAAYGLYSEVVDKTAGFAPAFERAMMSDGPALLELRVDPEAITPRATITGLREAALAAKG